MATPFGVIWMSPIETELYGAMQRKGLDPIPQYWIQGYFVDFAFPSLWLAVEADGAVHLQETNVQRDHHRDWILRRAGWTVLRFHGSTIMNRPDNCAYVIRREVVSRGDRQAVQVRMAEERRRARAEAWRHPLRTLLHLFTGLRTERQGSPSPQRDPPKP